MTSKGLPGNKIILLEKRSSSLGSTKTTPHPRASPQEYWHSDLTASMAAIEHESFAEDEILRRAVRVNSHRVCLCTW